MSGARPRRHPRPEPRKPPPEDQALPRARRPRREPRRPPRAAQRLFPLRRRLPQRREAPRRAARRPFFHGLLPAAAALRRRVGGGSASRLEDSLMTHQLSETREPWDTCVQTGPETANSRTSTRQIASIPQPSRPQDRPRSRRRSPRAPFWGRRRRAGVRPRLQLFGWHLFPHLSAPLPATSPRHKAHGSGRAFFSGQHLGYSE